MIVRRPLRAPEEHGALLADPLLEQAGQVLADNRRRLRDGPAILGRPWPELRRLAAEEALDAARAYLRQADDGPLPSFQSRSLLLSGHQPELVHPGVWVKNFALHRLAVLHDATPINLVVDYDTAKSSALRLPALAESESAPAHVATVPFDHWAGEAPYEEQAIRDRALFDTLAERAEPVWRPWGFRPMLPEFWAAARRAAERQPLLGECLAAARREFEVRWGCQNWEVPVSALCRTEAFAWFACHVLGDLPRFHALYNACVHDYRRVNGIRSRNHPVPDLGADGDWLEAPFWAWRAGAGRRARLFARQTEAGLELRAGAEAWPVLPAGGQSLVAAWRTLEARGFKVRPRALTNTLFARLFLGDLFLHGIGGGKYDELTDEIARRFYGVEPPRFLVVTATLRLPLPTSGVAPEDRRTLIRRLRSLRYNPQRHLPETVRQQPDVRELLRRREEWVGRQPPTRRGRRERYAALRDVTERLRVHVVHAEESTHQALRYCEQQLSDDAILRRRDYPACLFPEEDLRTFCTGVLTAL